MANAPKKTGYCLCSEATFGGLLERQQARPLPFEAFLRQYTGCSDGCGWCVRKLRLLLIDLGMYFE